MGILWIQPKLMRVRRAAVNRSAPRAVAPAIRNKPAKGSGPKPEPSALLSLKEQLKVESNVDSKFGISLLSISSAIEADMSTVNGDPFGKACHQPYFTTYNSLTLTLSTKTNTLFNCPYHFCFSKFSI